MYSFIDRFGVLNTVKPGSSFYPTEENLIFRDPTGQDQPLFEIGMIPNREVACDILRAMTEGCPDLSDISFGLGMSRPASKGFFLGSFAFALNRFGADETCAEFQRWISDDDVLKVVGSYVGRELPEGCTGVEVTTERNIVYVTPYVGAAKAPFLEIITDDGRAEEDAKRIAVAIMAKGIVVINAADAV